MYRKTCSANQSGAKEEVGYVETDPSGRYGRFRETLGKGAMKIVYRAFDEVLGIEVAWNQVKLNDAFHSQQALHSLYSEVHLLKNLNHASIIQYHTSWIDVNRRTFNFITEMFTSGTLREYRQKYPRVDIQVIKRWAREILKGLAYLHALEPPVIHRDLKCDNIFVNGHLGQIKIGDLGLAATLRQSRRHSVIGTPEFMAPELYEEEYNELVDVYAFGMCVLEMLTCEYPYSECCNLPQIYKKVTSGKLPEAFYKIEDAEAQQFVRKCLENVSTRLSATDLLLDPFMEPDEGDALPLSRVPSAENLIPCVTVVEKPQVFEADSRRTIDMSVTGTMNSEDDIVFLKFQISDKDGNARNIHFPFNIVNDTSIEVALEMVKELEITGWEPFEIAEMIEKEISTHVPDWKEHSLSIAHHHHHQQSFNFKDEDDYDNDERLRHPLEIAEIIEKEISFHGPDLQEHSSSKAPHNQQSFNYKDEDDSDDDERLHHPFYHTNSSCSSQDSLPVSYDLPLRSESNPAINEYLHESPVPSCDANCEKDSSGRARECRELGKSLTKIVKIDETAGFVAANSMDRRRWPRLPRMSSLVDMRTQVFHRSMMELINKRRTLKIVGSLQNVNEVHDKSAIYGKSKSVWSCR